MAEQIYGFHPVREALRRRPQDVARVWVSRSRGGGRLTQIEELCRRHGVSVEAASEPMLRRLGGAVHNGFVAELRDTPPQPIAAGGDPELLVLLEDVQDPRNLGALLRVCECVGVGKVLIRDRGSAPLSPVAVKASAGASDWLPLERVVNSGRTISDLKQQGYWIYGAEAGGDAPWEVDLSGPVLLCFGGEEKGLRPLTRTACDRLVGLPVRGHVESLNVASAASAILYECLRQRQSLHAAAKAGYNSPARTSSGSAGREPGPQDPATAGGDSGELS